MVMVSREYVAATPQFSSNPDVAYVKFCPSKLDYIRVTHGGITSDWQPLSQLASMIDESIENTKVVPCLIAVVDHIMLHKRNLVERTKEQLKQSQGIPKGIIISDLHHKPDIHVPAKVAEFAQEWGFDYHLVKYNKEAIPILKEKIPNVIWYIPSFQVPPNPKFVEWQEREAGIYFLGILDHRRMTATRELFVKHCPICIQTTEHRFPSKQVTLAYSKWQMGLNVCRERDFNLRNCEIFLAGALMVNDKKQVGLTDMMEEGVHYIGWDNVRQIPEIVNHYIKNKEAARNIAYNGWKLWHEKYTDDIIVSQIVDHVKGVKPLPDFMLN